MYSESLVVCSVLAMYSSGPTNGPRAEVTRRLSLFPQESSTSMRTTTASRKTSYFYIKSSLESLNYRPLTNQIELERQKSTTFRQVRITQGLRIFTFVLVGTCTAVLGLVLEAGVEIFGNLKYNTFERFAMKHMNGAEHNFLVFTMYRFIGVFVPVMVGAALVTFLAPFASGGGVAQSIGYLNGVQVPHVLSLRGLAVKTLSTICTVVSGLAGGKEGPMMHMGGVIGGRLPTILPSLELRLEHERRDFAAAGLGAGIAVAFGAPIGGMMLALEEGVSFLELSLMWKIYLCCVFAYAWGAILISLFHGEKIRLNNSELMSLGFISSEVTDYNFFELIPFAFMAVVGGLIGALLTKIHIGVALFRDRYIKSRTRKMIAAFIAVCVVVLFQVSAIRLLRNCSPLPEHLCRSGSGRANSTCSYRTYCSEGDRSDMATLFSLTQGDLLRLYFGPDVIQMSSLALFAVLYFILMCMTMGLSLSAGIFVPQIILGASWGRMFGTFLSTLDDAGWAEPAKYAYLGAAAQLSGTVGKTFSILVIFVEASGSIALSFPLMVIVSVTRLVCTFFVLPIYETQMHLMGLPFLPFNPPPLDCDVPATRFMSKSLVTLPLSPTVATIIGTLKAHAHNGYPVVELNGAGSPVLLGLILRQQLLILLKYRAYAFPTPATARQMAECYVTYIRNSRTRMDERRVFADVEVEAYDAPVDLRPYYNCYPLTATSDMPMVKAYELFRSLGARHLVVITKNYEPVGMVTRKDLAKLHTVEKYCGVRVKEMLIKD